ncbi:hypothetical protein EDC01DRAFT_620453 [Geopyxis carbonaria]|nr:hypothetical protein EDC01DRAFT_620453 [Geopyxis carbonaria]
MDKCAIQACLQKNHYNEARCSAQIDALYDCCTEMYKREGLAAKNICCPKKNLLELKLKQRAQAGSSEAQLQSTKMR